MNSSRRLVYAVGMLALTIAGSLAVATGATGKSSPKNQAKSPHMLNEILHHLHCGSGITCSASAEVDATSTPSDPILCTLTLPKAAAIYIGAAKQSITWNLVASDSNSYRFERSGTHPGGIFIADNNYKDQSSDDIPFGTFTPAGMPPTSTTTTLGSIGKNTKAFGYTIYVERLDPDTGTWKRCGTVDPVIVNRD